ncbi:signal recognition particle-docking protein FtsY [Candidatus Pacearchaeota archaeon]|nr:signal recognition particle-docking protein FtsY [Candidatus Pacearchaeota archaeon]MBD3283670.1 signal recognition particle-docking protein FtsY [Candidatus Pacearchaeota archaeon]
MFGKLKDKLKSWFQSSKEKIEEEAEVIEKTAKELEEKPKEEEKKKPEKTKKTKEEKKKHKIEREIKEKEQEIKKREEELKKEKRELEKDEEKLEKKEKEPEKKIEKEIEKKEDIKEKLEEKKQEIKEEIKEIKEPEKKSFFSKMKSKFSYKITPEEFNSIFEDLEMLLLENNVALEVVEDIKKNLSEKLIGKEILKENLEDEIKDELKNILNNILIEPDNPLDIIKISKKPFTILFFGINGTGKTTTIAKIAHFLKRSGFSVILAAADTFRAASIEQLSEHAKKLQIPVVKHDYGSDPAAVGFDAIKYAEKHKIDVVLIDTAGRMHTKTNLISEMEKISRVTKPDLKIFVAESIAGNDATEQAKIFHEAIEIDGSILSKVDVDEKGGTIISVSHATKKPIFYLGIGQNYPDLELFNKNNFIKKLGL